MTQDRAQGTDLIIGSSVGAIRPGRRDAFLPAFFAATLFVSATLLFLIQPMIGKMVLPLLGGTPGVWNTCLVFFQATLLAGYTYAHVTPARLGIHRQAMMHVALLLLPFLVLPIGVAKGWLPPVSANPIPWLLSLLIFSVGLPFFMLSTTAPLMQKWFANTHHAAAQDPYFLYAASNLGSMVALLGYPIFIEPHLRLADQSRLWAAGYALLVVLVAGCAVLARRSGATSAQGPRRSGFGPEITTSTGAHAVGRATPVRRLRWLALAFVPSSLMVGVTTHLTTDIAAIPFLWVLPLALYLLSFILVFAKAQLLSHKIMLSALPGVVLLYVFTMLTRVGVASEFMLLFSMAVLFVVAMACHGELARDRPSVEHLTEFYLWMSCGGVLGGFFNAVVAPLIFDTVAEYPLAMVLACLLLPRTHSRRTSRLDQTLDFALPFALGAAVLALFLGLPAIGLDPGSLKVVILTLLIALCSMFRPRPLRLALGVGALLLAGSVIQAGQQKTLHRERSFFGVLRVLLDKGEYHALKHGTTLHGMQALADARRREPLAYYHNQGPIGQVFSAFSGPDAKPHVAVIGLGTGTLAAYGEPGQQMTFYEIDPAVERIARSERYFTYLRDSRAVVNVVLGDARLRLAEAPARHYGLIVVDAFSSDAIPVHLITREALRLYLDKLAEDGVLAFHISNRYLSLKPVLAALARDAGLAGLEQTGKKGADAAHIRARWVVLARRSSDFGKLATDARWKPLADVPGTTVWTDDFSNLFGVFNWSWEK